VFGASAAPRRFHAAQLHVGMMPMPLIEAPEGGRQREVVSWRRHPRAA
jgi:hypothetical protein